MPIEEEVQGKPRKRVTTTPQPKEDTVQPLTPHQWTTEERQAHSQRMKERMSDPEVRQRLAQANKGRTMSDETREKLRQANKGRVVSPETREKIRQALLARYHAGKEVEPEEDTKEAA